MDLFGLPISSLIDKGFAVVVALLLLRVLQRELRDLTTAVVGLRVSTQSLHDEIRSMAAHQTSRMQEIRDQLYGPIDDSPRAHRGIPRRGTT